MNYKEKADFWLSCNGLDRQFRAIIKNMTDDELKEAFTEDLEFGTGGIRGIMGPGTARLNIYNVRKVALGFGRYLIKNVKKALKRGVAISFFTSSSFFSSFRIARRSSTGTGLSSLDFCHSGT